MEEGCPSAAPGSEVAIRLLAVSEELGRLVLASPEGELEEIEIGGTVPRSQLRVEEILPDRVVVLHESPGEGSDGCAVRGWLFPLQEGEERSRLEWIDARPPPGRFVPVPTPAGETDG